MSIDPRLLACAKAMIMKRHPGAEFERLDVYKNEIEEVRVCILEWLKCAPTPTMYAAALSHMDSESSNTAWWNAMNSQAAREIAS